MKIAVKEIGKPLQYIETTEKYRMKCAADLINPEKHITPEFVVLSPDKHLSLGVDSDGLLKNLPTNFLMEIASNIWPIQKMVGTVVFIRIKPIVYPGEIWDYEVDDLTQEDCLLIERILNDDYQERLKEHFTDYENGEMFCIPL